MRYGHFFKYSGVVFTFSHFNLFMFYDFTVIMFVLYITVAVCCPCDVINDDD